MAALKQTISFVTFLTRSCQIMAVLYFRFRPYLFNTNLGLDVLKLATKPGASTFDVDKAAAKCEADLIPVDQFFLTPEEKLHQKALRENYQCPLEDPDLTPVNFIPRRLLDGRIARIHRYSKNALQSGTFNTRHWRITFTNEKQWDSPLMGWGASADALSSVVVKFETAEDAAYHCEENGWRYFIDGASKVSDRSKRRRRRSYRDNFLWDKRSRVSTK